MRAVLRQLPSAVSWAYGWRTIKSFLSPEGELRSRADSRSARMAPRAAVDGVAAQVGRGHLRAIERPRARRGPESERDRGPRGARLARQMGVETRGRARARTWNPGGVRCADQGVGGFGGGVPGPMTPAEQRPRGDHMVGTVPPSITYSTPVIEAARGDDRKATRSATSRGFAGRPSGIPPRESMTILRPPS